MKKSLIALAVLAAGYMAAAGENGSDTGGTGTGAPPPPAPNPVKLTKARVLTDCEHGKANDLVELPLDVAKGGEKNGLLDTDKAAVAYAASLEQNKPKSS